MNNLNNLWLQFTDWEGSPGPTTYVADVYDVPFGGTAVVTGVIARNAWEEANNAYEGCGYQLSPGSTMVGDIVELEQLPTNIRFKVLGECRIDGKLCLVFSERLNPIVFNSAEIE